MREREEPDASAAIARPHQHRPASGVVEHADEANFRLEALAEFREHSRLRVRDQGADIRRRRRAKVHHDVGVDV